MTVERLANHKAETARPVFDPRAPLPIARAFLDTRYTWQGFRTFHAWQGQFYRWTGSAYECVDGAAIRAEMYEMLDEADRLDGKGNVIPFRPNRTKVTDVVDALRAAANLPASVAPPAWLPDIEAVQTAPADLLPCINGLLNLPDRELEPATPAIFNLNALPVEYAPDAGDPKAWESFLHDLWPDDRASIETLQEIFGYSLTPDTRQHKIFSIVGPPRSGKGTIGRVARGLIGSANVCGPSLRSLSGNFGLEPLIGRQLAILADARLGGRDHQHAVAESLLNISGEDGQTVARKHLPAWGGILPTRFLLLTNELPRITDMSGALASRFIVLLLTESFYGREDQGLTERLLGELPGILNWSIEGWHRLRDRGHFLQPESARDAVRDLEDLGSPVGAFVRERCEARPGLQVEIRRLFVAWQAWCEEQGREHPGTRQTFGRDLRAVLPGLKTRQPRDGDERLRLYEGVDLKP